LYIADRQAREEVEKRAAIQRKIAEKEKEQKEVQLRHLAQKAREERANLFLHREPSERTRDEDEKRNELEREDLRFERRKDIERELRLSSMSAENRSRFLERNEDRDISEKIALGIARPTLSKDMVFDQRLFNQSAGLTSGLADDEGMYWSHNVFYVM
jgi:SNW domain-containing protein 1